MSRSDIMIVGATGNTHVASSLKRAAAGLGLDFSVHDTGPAYRGPDLLRKIVFHAGGRRPLKLAGFSRRMVQEAARLAPRVVLTIGQAPISAKAVAAIRRSGAICANWSTDDPWNRTQFARWHLDSLPGYDVIFTPRRSNMDDFGAAGCRRVEYMPFGYDPDLFPGPDGAPATGAERSDVLFVGGGDKDRAAFMVDFMRAGLAPTLVGDFWNRFPGCGPHAIGLKTAAELAALTVAASVNLCLVRRANRDGHVMRSFEIPAIGGFMIAEDTQDHREIFGPELECVLYFRTPEEAAEKARWALEHPDERARMAAAGRRRVTAGRHTYRDRLANIMIAAS